MVSIQINTYISNQQQRKQTLVVALKDHNKLRNWSDKCWYFGLDLSTSHPATSIRKNSLHFAQRPWSSWSTRVNNLNDIPYLHISQREKPFLSLLKEWQVLADPPLPEEVTQILHLPPMTAHVIVLLDKNTDGQAWLILEQKEMIWGQAAQIVWVAWRPGQWTTI